MGGRSYSESFVEVVVRVRHRMRSGLNALRAVKDEPDEIALKRGLTVTANFFRMISNMADGVLLHFFDITLDRVGARALGATSSRRGGTQN